MKHESLQPIDTTVGLPRRWIVLDWGALRSLAETPRLPEDASFVISDFTFLEATDGTTARGSTINKLQSLLSFPIFRSRVLVGHHWQAVALEEHRTKALSSARETIDHHATMCVRSAPAFERRWAHQLGHARQSNGYLDYTREKLLFVHRANAFARAPENVQSTVLRELRTNSDALCTFMRRPRTVTDLLYANRWIPSWRSRKWRHRLEVFPDRYAIGRWARLLAYYGIRRLMAPDERDDRFSNNFEDATYAFLASYTGFLASKDEGLRTCVRALFPNVALVDLTT